MRKLYGLVAVALLVTAILALSSCYGSGGRNIYALPFNFLGGSLLPFVEGADSGEVALTFSAADQRAYWVGNESLGAFDDASAGGFVFVNETTSFDIWNDSAGTYYSNLGVFDVNGDGFAESIAVYMRALSAAAAEAEVGAGYAKAGGAAYGPAELWVENMNLYLPMNQTYADQPVTVYRWETTRGATEIGGSAGTWVPLTGFTYSVRLHPYSGFGTWYVVEILNYTGFLGQFGAFIPWHTAGSGST